LRIRSIQASRERFPLSRPYSIAGSTADTDVVENLIVRIDTDAGLVGLGAGAPEDRVTGETEDACAEALSPERIRWLEGRSLDDLGALTAEVRRAMSATPAAQAAIDMALHDLDARRAGVPLVERLGRRHRALPTSVTIGIKPLDATLREADEYLSRGFRVLKLKLGSTLEEDVERTLRLREHVGSGVQIRVDMNQGHSAQDYLAFVEATRKCALEFAEQPLPADRLDEMRSLPAEARDLICIDESVLDDEDAERACVPVPAGRVINVKLMKCGGVTTAMKIGAVAARHGRELMWGCMDESRISIAAALHAALACEQTRYLDLDGSLDLARDVAEGGFVIEDGVMSTTGEPGLGVRLL
jgi:L-alanine-DL-glutamate epimerase-like enolase superfamily enzyme